MIGISVAFLDPLTGSLLVAMVAFEVRLLVDLTSLRTLPIFRWYLWSVILRALCPQIVYGGSPWWDAPPLVLRVLACLELFTLMGQVPARERIHLLWSSLLASLAAAIIIAGFVQQPGLTHPTFVSIRQYAHVGCAMLCTLVALYHWYRPARPSWPSERTKLFTAHRVLMCGYLWVYSLTGFGTPGKLAEWVTIYRIFLVAVISLLLLWLRVSSVASAER